MATNRDRSEFGARLLEARKHAGMTQAQLAKAVGMSQSALAEAERVAAGSSFTSQLADATGVRPSWLASGEGEMIAMAYFPEGRRVVALDAEDPLPDGIVLIKESRVRFSGGDGHITPHYEEVEESLPASYRRAWFTSEGMNPAHVRRFQVKGDSMERTLFDGDTVLVHMKETAVRDGLVYAFRYGDELRIKRLYKRLSGGLEIRSDNPAFSSEEVNADLANEHITVIGRVREKAGKGGL